MKNKQFFRATLYFFLFSLLTAALTAPPIFASARGNHLGISSIHLLVQTCLLILGILITRKLSRGYMVHGFTALIICNLFYAVVLFQCTNSCTNCPLVYSIDAIWHVRSTSNNITILDTLPLFLTMNAMMISFLFWLERHSWQE